jgi:kynurenine formamidase
MDLTLWEYYAELKEKYRFVELSHDLSPDAPHWSGFPPMTVETAFTYDDGFYVNRFCLVGQYGTHVDAPAHFAEGRRTLHEIGAEELLLPLCVVDICNKVRTNADYAATERDIRAWEEVYGTIPEGAFVALRTDWWKRRSMDNYDVDGAKHYPGWGLDAVRYLVERRRVAAIGQETAGTDPAVITARYGYVSETYILDQQRYQIELLRNLDQVPPIGALIVCGFPKVVDGAGFTARCFAICPRE